MIRGEIKLKSKEVDKNGTRYPVALFISVNGNEVENRGNGMEKAMLAKSSCLFMVKVFSGLNYLFLNFILCFEWRELYKNINYIHDFCINCMSLDIIS